MKKKNSQRATNTNHLKNEKLILYRDTAAIVAANFHETIK